MEKSKLIRITTVPLSLDKLLEGQLSFMNKYYSVIAISSDEENLINVGNKEGVQIHTIQLTRQITPIQDFKAVWNLYFYLKRQKPLIVHSHTPKAGIVGMLAAKLSKVPIRMHTVAGLPLMESTGLKRMLLNIVERVTYICANRVYPNSANLMHFIRNEGLCESKKIKVIGNGSSNGINTTHFNPINISMAEQALLKASMNVLPLDFVFIFVGRLVSDKGINELISAFKRLSEKNAGIKLLLVGPFEPNLDPLLPSTIYEIESNTNINCVGYQQDVRPYLSISDCLVFPSYREGFPNVVMQAGAMGLPSIVSNINGCNEIIVEGINGTIVPVKDEWAIYQAMEKILNNKDWHDQLKRNARNMIVNRFEQSVIWDALLAEYRTLESHV
jgi:glycosyltransferase involved in cell wall biosynthesis